MTAHRPSEPDLLSRPASPARAARALLRSLRDVDLDERVAVTRERAVAVAGCTSRDEPVERGVRYRLRTADGDEETLSLAWAGDALEVQVHGAARWRRLRAPLRHDALGRTSAPDLGARLDPRDSLERGATHFLRRVVRAACA